MMTDPLSEALSLIEEKKNLLRHASHIGVRGDQELKRIENRIFFMRSELNQITTFVRDEKVRREMGRSAALNKGLYK